MTNSFKPMQPLQRPISLAIAGAVIGYQYRDSVHPQGQQSVFHMADPMTMVVLGGGALGIAAGLWKKWSPFKKPEQTLAALEPSLDFSNERDFILRDRNLVNTMKAVGCSRGDLSDFATKLAECSSVLANTTHHSLNYLLVGTPGGEDKTTYNENNLPLFHSFCRTLLDEIRRGTPAKDKEGLHTALMRAYGKISDKIVEENAIKTSFPNRTQVTYRRYVAALVCVFKDEPQMMGKFRNLAELPDFPVEECTAILNELPSWVQKDLGIVDSMYNMVCSPRDNLRNRLRDIATAFLDLEKDEVIEKFHDDLRGIQRALESRALANAGHAHELLSSYLSLDDAEKESLRVELNQRASLETVTYWDRKKAGFSITDPQLALSWLMCGAQDVRRNDNDFLDKILKKFYEVSIDLGDIHAAGDAYHLYRIYEIKGLIPGLPALYSGDQAAIHCISHMLALKRRGYVWTNHHQSVVLTSALMQYGLSSLLEHIAPELLEWAENPRHTAVKDLYTLLQFITNLSKKIDRDKLKKAVSALLMRFLDEQTSEAVLKKVSSMQNFADIADIVNPILESATKK